jgi:hypothetical protein
MGDISVPAQPERKRLVNRKGRAQPALPANPGANSDLKFV